MAKVTVNQSEYVFSHGKPAKGKGCWVFSASKNASVNECWFDNEFRTVFQAAKAAAEYFGVSEVFVQP